MRLSKFLKFTKNFLAQLAVFSLVLEQFIFVSTASASALPITPDGTTNTQVTQTASGVDQVNIAAPNVGGLSHNKFESYNVNTGGQIINNFSGSGAAAGTGANAVTQTQIGGLVTANPNLVSSGSAKVILNEVTSGNTSQLLGYTEIAGTKADLILANPNGIACLGCGFINTARLLMVAGSSNFDANGNLVFNLKEQANPNLYVPLITIDGLGLDVTRTSGTEIVASSVKLLSSIFGSDSNSVVIRTGEGRYDYATKAITGNNTQNNTDPVFAIDASALAQIQAGQVYLIATKQGVGVKMESEILASQTLNLDANGDIYYKSISVGNTATLRSSGTIQTTDSNSSISAPNLNIQASEFKNLGTASANNLAIQNTGTINNFGDLEALNLNLSNITNINNSGSIFGQNSLTISGTNLTNNSSGSIYSPVDYTITLTGLLTNSGLITSANNLNVNSNQLSNSSEISAQNNLTFSVAGSATSSRNLIAGNALNFSADSFTNSGATQSNSSSTFNLSALTNNSDSSIYSGSTLNLNLSSSLTNSGSISSQGNLSVTGSAAITNSNQILSNSDLSISASSLNNNSDGLVASLARSLTLVLTGNLQNDGDINAITNISVNSANFSNSGTILAGNTSSIDGSILSLGNLTVNSSGSFTNSGSLQSTKDTSITAGSSLSNSGLIKSLAKTTINTDSFTNQLNSTIRSDSDLAIATNGFSNIGTISTQNNFTANSSSLINSGSIYSANNFSVTNSSDITNSGTFYSDGSLTISSNNITNNSHAWIYGSKDISLNSNLDLVNAGNIQATTDLTLSIGRNSNNSGSIVGNQLTFTNSGDITNSGSIGSENNITLSAANLTNSGLIQSVENSGITLSGNLNNQSGSTIYSGGNLNVNGTGSLNNAGEISAVNSATITSSSLTNTSNILANNNLTINSTSIDNNGVDATLASINQALVLNVSDYLNNSGTIFAKTNFTLANSSGTQLNSVNNSREISFNKLLNVNSELKVKDFINSGIFASGSSADDLTITSSNSFDNQGSISSSKNFTINAANIFTNSGTVLANQNLTLSTDSITNSGEVSALGTLTITNSGDITNSNKILSNGGLNISANNLTNNSSAAIASLADALTLTITNNLTNNGQLSSASDLTIGAKSLTNSGDVLSNTKLSTTITNGITNSGNLQSVSDSVISASSLTNSGTIKSFGKSTINIAAITNQANALIFSNLDGSITSNTSLTNQGSILGNAKIGITSGVANNSNEIFSNGDLTLTLNGALTNSGNLSSLGNLTINSSSSVTNTNQILSSGNLGITANSLNNSNTIQSNGNLVLTLGNLTNSKNIISGGTFNITASGNVSNSSTLQSADNFTINAASFSNSANSLILAGKDLRITATSIANQNTKPSTSTITSGIVSASGAITLQTDNLNNNSGIIAGRSTTLNALNASSVNLSNTLGAFISTAAISLNLGALDYTITGTVTADNVDITATNIVNQGNVTASDYIKLNATGGNITNGFSSGDNSNVQLAAGTYIDFTASNNINNYATILGTTNTTLTATGGNVNNYSSGKITGGSGTTTVNALNGAFNNLYAASVFTANNNAIFNTKDLNNTGEISVANNLTTNITNNLNNNSTALIWAGNDTTFNVANTFTNTSADIYANRNLTIQKNTAGDKTTSVQNISGNIETYNGNILINATSLENKRLVDPLSQILNIPNARSNTNMSGWVYQYNWCGGNNCENWHYIYYGSNYLNSNSISGKIFSGKDLTLNLGSFKNDTSEIDSVGNTNISYQTSFTNNSVSSLLGNLRYEFQAAWDRDYHELYDRNTGALIKSAYTNTVSPSYVVNIPAYIKAGGSLNITQNGTTNASFINGSTVAAGATVGGILQQSQNTNVNKIDSYTLGQTGVINVDLSSITTAISNNSTAESGSSYSVSSASSSTSSGAAISTSGVTKGSVSAPTTSSSSVSAVTATISSASATASTSNTVFSGTFKINLDPSATTPLVESRSQFTDTSKFFGSSYYFDQLGLNGSSVLADLDRQTRVTNIRMLGDSFVETKLIMDQLKTLTNDSLFLSKTTTDPNQQIKELLDNSVNQFAALGLNAEDVAINGLTTAQANSLTKDIVTFELTTVNGISVLAPKIYLSQDSRNRLLNTDSITGGTALASSSTLFGKSGVTIDAANTDLLNSGSIVSDGDLTLNLASLVNKTNSAATAQIIAGNNLSITANTGDIKNIGANIGSVGALSLTSLKGNILNSALVSTNDSNLLSQNSDSYLLTASENNRTAKGIHSELLQSATLKGGSISIDAANNFTNLAAKITTAKNTLADSSTSSGNLAITAGNNVDIGTLQLHNKVETSWGGKKRGGTSIVETLANIGSTVSSANDLSLTSTGLSDTATTASINIIGSNISATGNGSLTSDFGNINIANAVDSKMTQDSAWKKGSFSSRSDSVYDYKESAVESNLNFGGNLTASAELGTMNLTGSTLKTGGDLNIGSFTVAQNTDGSYKTNADGTFQTVDGGSVAGVNIKAAELRSEHSESHSKSKLTLGDTLKTLANPIEMAKMELNVAKFMMTPSFNKATLEFDNGPKYEKTSSKTSTATTTQYSSTLDVGGNMMVNSTGDVNIAASDVNVAGNALMNVDGNINIASAAETNKSSSQTQSIEIGTMKLTRDTSHASGSAGVEGTGSKFEESLTTTTQKSSNINIGGSLLANVTNNLSSADSGNMTLAASNMTVGGDSIIKTAGDFSLTDAQNTSSYSTKESTLTVEAGAKVGNAYVDAGYAWKAVVDAEKKAIQAVEKLKKMEDLKDEGKASDKAVELAAAQVVLAQAAVASATLAAAAATAGAASAASTSFGTGMYGAGYLNITSSGIKNTTDTSTSQGSTFITNGDVDIAANNNVNLVGSILASANGNVSLSAAKDIKIEAGTNTLAQTSKQETIYGGGSVGNNGVQVNVGLSSGESDYNKTFYTNSQVSAENGTLTLNTGNDANISGANLLAKNVALNIGNNLNVSSKQTEEDFSSSGFGFSFGAGVGAGGNGGNIGGGVNFSSGDMHRLWVDDITTIKGTDSIAVNVGKDLNLTGAAILSDNLALAVSGNVNKKDLQDSYYSESMGIGVSTNFTTNGSQPTIPGTGGQPNQFPGGSTSISGNYAQNESSRTVYATIGGLDSTLTSATKDVTGGDFEGSLTVDHRLLSESGRNDILKQLNYSKNLAVTPFAALEASKNSEENNKTEKFFQAVAGATVANTRLLLNQDITAQQLAGDTTLIAYEGNSLNEDLGAKDRNAFYDSNNNIAAINADKTNNMTTEEVAGKIAHESIGHTIGGGSEFVAEFVENAVKNNWGDFQSGNTNFQLTLPQANVLNNSYASGVNFSNGSGVYSDVAFRIDPTATKFGHTIGYFQNEDGKWIEYQQFATGDVNPIAALMNKGYQQDIKTVNGYSQYDVGYDDNGRLIKNMTILPVTEEMLRNDPNTVYIETTKEQDHLVTQNILQRIDNKDSTPYRLWTNNCNTSFASACAAAGIKLPDIVARPDKFHQALETMYPKSNQNQ